MNNIFSKTQSQITNLVGTKNTQQSMLNIRNLFDF